MTIIDILEKIIIPLLAACFGAILAFRYQKNIELNRDKRIILQNLMIYRNVGAYELDWIKSLNAIDIAFNKNKKVRDLYHTFLAQTKPPIFNNHQYIETYFQLLYAMAQCSGYKNLTMQDIREFYSPEALVDHYPNMNVGSKPVPVASL